MNALISVFLAGGASVFLLAFQSRLVNTGNYLWAGLCSFSIAVAQGSLWHLLQMTQGSWSATVAYGLSGACAVTAAMFIHKKVFKT